MSADGSKMYATQGGTVAKNFFTSNNNGLAWTQSTNFPGLQMARGQIASSADGLTLYASPYWRSGPWGPLSSRDGGATWTVGVIDDPYRGLQTAVSANGKVALYTLNLNSASSSRGFMFTYDDDFIVSSDASFTMKINGTSVTDGQTFQLTPNSKTVNVSVVATESAATFGGFTCTQPGTCVAAEYYLGNYGNNESGTDQVVVTAVAPNRVTKLTKTITVTQPFIKRTILDYNADWGSAASNGKQEITSGSGLPSLASKDGYHFNHWSDGVTANPRTDAYGKNVSVYPIFGINATAGGVAINYNRIRGGYADTEGNDWNCQGVCREVPSGSDGPEVTAIPDDGMDFIRWSDGLTANPRKDLNVKAKIDVYPIFAPILVITANNVTGEVAAAVPSGTPSATILATVDIPLTTLKFDNAPSGAATVTVKPIANPAAAAATPFTAGASTKIVDINVTGITGPVTVCLDGGPTDSIFHFTGGEWAELPSRTYVGGQVCGVTTSFSPFAAAAPIGGAGAPAGPVTPPMLPTDKPAVTLTSSSIMCVMGTHSQTPTSSVFSLFVDGEHISTNFSATGDYLPSWIIPWATSSTTTRTASLTSATWAMSDAYKGKKVTCTTLAYSAHATGLTSSEVVTAP
jgi:hypothetical protein